MHYINEIEHERQLFKVDFKDKFRIWWAKGNPSDMSNELFIEQVLLYGNPDDWVKLKELYQMKEVRLVWYNSLLFNRNMFERKLQIAEFYLGYKNPALYIKRMQNFHPANYVNRNKRRNKVLF